MNYNKWKTIWDSVVNNDAFRRKYLGNPGSEYGEVLINGTGVHGEISRFGTILMKGYCDEDHFAAYRGETIFDPAGNQYSYFSRVKYNYTIKKSFPGFEILDWHPQVREGDTFCQTWSLYWLKNPVGTKSLFEICKDIENSEDFYTFVPVKQRDFLKGGLTPENIEEILKG
jgi:hypothetical protein